MKPRTDAECPDVRVEAITRGHVLAYVDGVRVRIRSRRNLPPLWLCDEHPGDGRTGCEHVAALADTPIPTH